MFDEMLDTLSDAATHEYEAAARSVSLLRKSGPDPQLVGLALAGGRIAVGLGALAAPRAAVRVLGVNTATAKRVTFLSRMLGARDAALGVGALESLDGAGGGSWLIAGAAADIVDAVVIAGAVRSGTAGGFLAKAISAGALGAAALGVWAGVRIRRNLD